MPSVETLIAFVLISLVCVVTPGPDLLGLLTYGMSRGRRAGVGFGVGCGAGCLSHTLWAAVGVSALIASSQAAFRTLQYAGAAYLFYLGVRALGNSGAFHRLDTTTRSTAGRFWPFAFRGFISNALNPKVGMFFLAFLPQFIDPIRPAVPQFGVLGTVMAGMTMIVFSVLGYYSGLLGERLEQRPGIGRWLDRMTGGLFIGLGLHLALSGRRP